MGNPSGFIELQRVKQPARPVTERTHDWREVTLPYDPPVLRGQISRCMGCGIPFCHQGCPLGNLIPSWNDLAYRDRWADAIARLHSTNNFPEVTGRVCPAPCESACVLAIDGAPVTIKSAEAAIVDRAFAEGWIQARRPLRRSGRRVAVVGSGPAGLAAADQLNRAGHSVTVFERDDRVGGLLRYGIPAFKLEKGTLDRRLALMAEEGVYFRPGCHVGSDLSVETLRREYDAVVLAGGATQARDLHVPGRELRGVHLAMEYLVQQNRRCEGDVAEEPSIDARDRHVVVVGGGDTGADCLGTAIRQQARSIHQLELLPAPPAERGLGNPWPQPAHVFRVSSAHEEGGERLFSVSTLRFEGDDSGRVKKLRAVRLQPGGTGSPRRLEAVPGSEFELPADLVLLAIGFTGPERQGLLEQLAVRLTPAGTVWRDERWMTSVPGIFTAGDMQRGQSLVVWAIAEGRSCARGVDLFLMGESDLPAPVA
jgi:glutamate synthase (NADPH/NADH) small chain